MTARNDATDTPITVTWKGKTYKVVPSAKWSIDTLEALEDGKITQILRSILDGDGYPRFRETQPLMAETGEFFDKVMKAVTPGN